MALELIFSIGLLGILTAASGFFSSSEIALFSLSSHKVASYEEASDSRLRLIAALVRQPRDLLVTIFMLNTVVNILLQNVASHLFGEESGWMLKVGVPFFLTLLGGEVIPKYLGLKHSVALSYAVAPSINMLQECLAPIRRMTIAVTGPISRLMFFFLRKNRDVAKEEISHALKAAQEQNVVEPTEVEWATGYLELLDSTVKELMRPKEDVLFYDIHTPIAKLMNLFIQEQCTRVPVCDRDLDHVLGIVHAVDFFINKDRISPSFTLENILKKALFVPEVASARMLLSHLYRHEEIIALTVDEYGSVTGLITLEDLAEMIIGEVSDYRNHKAFYTRAGKDEIIASGKMDLAELNNLFGTNLASENMVTVGGWLTEQIQEVPANGFTYEKEGLFFHVLTATQRRIQRLYIRRQKEKAL